MKILFVISASWQVSGFRDVKMKILFVIRKTWQESGFGDVKMKIALLILLSFITACAIIPKETLKDVDMTITSEKVRLNPTSFTGRKVVWGGIILSIENMEEVTVIEVFQTRLTSALWPTKEPIVRAGSRFLVRFQGYLDPVIYKVNSGITVVGLIGVLEKKKIGNMDYPYPVLTPVEIFLVNLEEKDYPPPPLPPWGYSPYYPYYGQPYWPYYMPAYPWYPYP